MDKKLFRSVLLLMVAAAALTLFVIKIDTVFSLIGLLFSVLLPAFIGIFVALILDRPFNWFRRTYLRLFKKSNHKHSLSIGLGVASTYLAVFAFIALFLIIVAPAIANSVKELISNTDVYAEKIEVAVNDFIAGNGLLKDKIAPIDLSNLDVWIADGMDMLGAYAKEHATQLFGVAAELVGTIASVAIGLVISVYVMISRHHLKWQAKKTVYAVFPQKTADYIRKVTKLGSKAVSNYIFARIIDSIIVGIICFVCMALFGFEYAALISFIVGVTNFIPILGPFLGGVPSALLLLLVSPAQCFWFIVFICVLQFLDSNFIDLRIAGEATGLPTLGVLTCVTAGGSLFGVVGFVMSVPFGAVVYRLVKDAVIRISREKNLPLNDEELRDRPTPKKLSSEETK